MAYLNNAWCATELTREVGGTVSRPEPARSLSAVSLIAPKMTHSTVLRPDATPKGLSFGSVTVGAMGAASMPVHIRAAILSGAFLIVFVASRELDVDPDEFEVLEPRYYGPTSAMMPIVQIVDALPNGSGLCKRLSSIDASGEPMVARIVDEIVRDPSAYPLADLLRGGAGGPADSHAQQCLKACYECLCRYGNQPYHGLLDWRLGLDFLAILRSADHDCGLSSASRAVPWWDFETISRRYALDILEVVEGSRLVDEVDGLDVIALGGDRCAVIVHPLWDWDSLLDTNSQLSDLALRYDVRPASTFNLARRMVATIDRLRF